MAGHKDESENEWKRKTSTDLQKARSTIAQGRSKQLATKSGFVEAKYEEMRGKLKTSEQCCIHTDISGHSSLERSFHRG